MVGSGQSQDGLIGVPVVDLLFKVLRTVLEFLDQLIVLLCLTCRGCDDHLLPLPI